MDANQSYGEVNRNGIDANHDDADANRKGMHANHDEAEANRNGMDANHNVVNGVCVAVIGNSKPVIDFPVIVNGNSKPPFALQHIAHTFSMKRFLLASALAATFTLGGCANNPVGTGPTTNSANRLEVILTTVQPINPNFYYAVAFDDQTGDGQGPTAIIGNTSVLNGVVGGNFRLAVIYHLNQFQVYYRTDPTDAGTERQVLDSPFFVQPVATTSGIQFTLDLDAQLTTGNYFLPRNSANLAPDRLDLNFVTTSTILRSAQDNRVKPIDSFGPATASTPIIDFQIAATRRTENMDNANDERLDVDPSFTTQSSPEFANYGNLDVNNLQLNITRNRSTS